MLMKIKPQQGIVQSKDTVPWARILDTILPHNVRMILITIWTLRLYFNLKNL